MRRVSLRLFLESLFGERRERIGWMLACNSLLICTSLLSCAWFRPSAIQGFVAGGIYPSVIELQSVYLEQNRVFKAGLNSAAMSRNALHASAWDNGTGLGWVTHIFRLVFRREKIELTLHPAGDD